jgi:hypothetical protein
MKYRELVASCLFFVMPAPAFADNLIETIPTGWRLQNYLNASDLVTWYTGSSCNNGLLTFPSTASEDIKNRYYSLILSAKSAGRSVGIFYETTSGACSITSFFSP